MGIETAIIGSAALSAGASFLGGRKAEKSANAVSARQFALDAEALDFQKQQYQDWQDIYGPVQKNLSSFYQGLTPEAFTASGLQEYEQEYQNIETELLRSFAQRGVDTPAKEAIMADAALTKAEGRATIRAEAPLKVASAKQSFLSSNTTNPSAPGVTNALHKQGAFFGNEANRLRTEANQGYAGVGKAVGEGVAGYLQHERYKELAGGA